MDEKTQRFSGKPVSEQIVKYYQVNHIKKFKYSRPFTRKDPNSPSENEFANLWLERTIVETKQSLPGILRWFPVENSNTFEISPLRNAIETMENTNKELRDLILLYNREKAIQLSPLSLKLNGKLMILKFLVKTLINVKNNLLFVFLCLFLIPINYIQYNN